jgi:hypothetical protein
MEVGSLSDEDSQVRAAIAAINAAEAAINDATRAASASLERAVAEAGRAVSQVTASPAVEAATQDALENTPPEAREEARRAIERALSPSAVEAYVRATFQAFSEGGLEVAIGDRERFSAEAVRGITRESTGNE